MVGCKSNLYPQGNRYSVGQEQFEFYGETTKPTQEFVDFINHEFMPWLEKKAKSLYGDQYDVVSYNDNPYFYGEASCQGSHGYLYIGCWQK